MLKSRYAILGWLLFRLAKQYAKRRARKLKLG
jgi:hypothetical protein